MSQALAASPANAGAAVPGAAEKRLRHALFVWIRTGLLFMLLPGTFLGVWNLVAISDLRSGAGPAPEWIQAHGQAQVFGWIGSFILGIGFYSLSKMGALAGAAVNRAAMSWVLWTAGVTLRWVTGVYGWQWRVMLPAAAVLEFGGFWIFFRTVTRHRIAGQRGGKAALRPAWITVVGASTFGFFLSLLAMLGVSVWLAVEGRSPAVPHEINQRLLAMFLWLFLLPAIWGFNARWLPAYGGFREGDMRILRGALLLAILAVTAALIGSVVWFTWLAVAAAALSAFALRIFERIAATRALPSFIVRVAYTWLLTGSGLAIWAAYRDQTGGIWGASRHALTVGFVSVMVFAVAQFVLPTVAGTRALFSRRVALTAVILLNLGCAMRVLGEPPAYEYRIQAFWHVLPCSAVIELSAFTLFALNLLLTFREE